MSSRTINRASGHVVLGLSLFAMVLAAGATVLAVLGGFDPSPDGGEASSGAAG